MKKARIALSAIALFAVIGGAYAVKANRGGGAIAFCKTTTTGLPQTTYIGSTFVTSANATLFCTAVSTTSLYVSARLSVSE
jgi:hypothetical protein